MDHDLYQGHGLLYYHSFVILWYKFHYGKQPIPSESE